MILETYFLSLFSHLNNTNTTVTPINISPAQISSFVAIKPFKEGIEFEFNENLSQSTNIDFIKNININNYYLVAINNNEFKVNGKSLKKLLIAFILANNEFIKNSAKQNFKLLYEKDKNKVITGYLFILAKLIAENKIKEEALDALTHAAHALTSVNNELIAKVSQFIPNVYAKIAVFVGEYISFRMFVKIIIDVINKFMGDVKLTYKLLPATIVAAGVGFVYLTYLSSMEQIIGGQHAHMLDAAKYAILLDALVIGIMYVFIPLLTGHMTQQFSRQELDKKTNNAAQLLSA